jgi:hypothetical protein
MSFVIAVLSSVIGSIVFLAGASLVSSKARWVVTAALSRLVDIDVEFVFRSPRTAADDVQKELRRARFVHLLTGRGNELQRETFSSLFAPGPRLSEISILLPCTEHQAATVDWVDDREAELSAFDPAYGRGTVRGQVRSNAEFLRALPPPLEVRRYDAPHIGRILVTDRYAYLTPYAEDAHGRDSKVIKFRRGGEMYEFLERLFAKSWLGAHEELPPAVPGTVLPPR